MTRVLLLLWLPQLYVALQLGPATRGCQSRSSVSMRANAAGVDVSSAAREIIEHFLAATERGDAAAATEVCSEDLLYKTHRSTTESLAAAQERLHTKVPSPDKVTVELHEESKGQFVREIIVKPVPFVKVAVRQEFDVVCPSDDECRLSRAEFIKQ